ncbi:trypsin-like cysteine/serine peptidase domain-containing protein [Trichoderma barbatum]
MLYRLSFEFGSDAIMEYPRIIAPGDVHRSRNENQQPEVDKSLDKAHFDLNNSVVRLQFDFGEGIKYGTGFFVNFPSNKHDVILTAAHNLINDKKVTARNLHVFGGDDKQTETVQGFRVCPQYEELLDGKPDAPEKGYYDYGIILLAKDVKRGEKRLGLGLSLGVSSHSTLQGSKEARVSGYGEDPNAVLQHSSGIIKRVGNQLLEYKAPTEPGMSGSPVWVAYGGHPMVVGIHNTGAKNKASGSRGTRITAEVFRNLCLWSEIGFFGKRLCAAGGKTKLHNTYLSFSQHSDFAKVFLGSTEAAAEQDNVTFDIIPTTIYPKWTNKAVLYAFKFHKPSTWSDKDKCWVEWQPARQRAILVDTLKDVNLVRLTEKLLKSGKKRYVVLLPVLGDEGKNQELRLYDDDRDEDDIEDGMTEFAGVWFAGFGSKEDTIGSRQFMIE